MNYIKNISKIFFCLSLIIFLSTQTKHKYLYNENKNFKHNDIEKIRKKRAWGKNFRKARKRRKSTLAFSNLMRGVNSKIKPSSKKSPYLN